MAGQRTSAPVKAPSPLSARLRAGGIVAPRIAIREAKRAGLPLELACALLEKESAGGRNVYGHDPSIFRGRGAVTRANYADYRRQRIASRNKSMQGVGPCQLTWWEFQDTADAQGGCWRPEINMRTGFSHLATLVKRYGVSDGARRYNGAGAAAEAYSRDLVVKARRWESIIDGAHDDRGTAGSATPTMLRRGEVGKPVERLTKRLARVHSPVTHKPYLSKPSGRLDAEVERAVEAFQRDHGLQVDGVAGPKTVKAVARARERQQGQAEAPVSRPERNGDTGDRRPASRLAGLADELHRRDEDAEQAWRRLVAYGHRRRRMLLAEKATIDARKGGADGEGTRELLEALGRIEGRLKTLVEVTEHQSELTVAGPAPSAPPAGAVVPAETVAPASSEGPAPGGDAVAPPAPTERPLDSYKVPELLREVEVAEKRRRELQAELIERYDKADQQLARLTGEPRPAAAAAPGGGGVGVRERRDRPRRRPLPSTGPTRSERDPLGGNSVNTTLGDRGVFVRRSKIALSRYLAKGGSSEHAALRRRLRREAATPKAGNLASPAWGQAVKAAQHVSGRPVTGELDGALTHVLLPYWPRDHVAKRALRSTPGWRAIPGQLTPNFNVKELACKDRAHTPYVQGMMREQGLSKKDARARAKGMAKRLERLRKLGGDRPLVINSAFRTRAYNASLDGSATNSAHTRGFAVDTTPPRGISLDQHKQHVLQAFECGVGYYPPARGYFIHGDFDHTLGGRRTW